MYDMTANTESNKKLSPIVTKLFLKGRKLNISLVFISQSYYKVPKFIRLKVIILSWKFLTKENFSK